MSTKLHGVALSRTAAIWTPNLKHSLFLRANFPCLFHFSPSRSNKDLNSVSVTQTTLTNAVLRALGRDVPFLELSNSGLFKIRMWIISLRQVVQPQNFLTIFHTAGPITAVSSLLWIQLCDITVRTLHELRKYWKTRSVFVKLKWKFVHLTKLEDRRARFWNA